MEQVFPIGNLELASFLASFLIWVQSQSQSQSQFDIKGSPDFSNGTNHKETRSGEIK